MLYRSYFNPQPSVREIMDNVSNFMSGLSGCLKSGAIRKCQFTVEFRMDVFRYLFRDRGTKPTRGLGKLYQKVDFSEQFFSSEWDKVYDRLGDGCQVDFPIRMHSKLRWSPIVYTQGEDGMLVHKPQSFSEVVVLNVVKKHF